MNRRRFFGVTAALAVPGALYALVTRNAEACGTHARAAGGADADAEPRHADGMRSLLSCFESKMPQTCGICRGEAEMAAKLAAEGKTLTEIRAAVDKRWG
jgi:hypothetical protein